MVAKSTPRFCRPIEGACSPISAESPHPVVGERASLGRQLEAVEALVRYRVRPTEYDSDSRSGPALTITNV